MRKTLLPAFLAALVLGAGLVPASEASTATPAPDRIQAAVAYLASVQMANGAFRGVPTPNVIEAIAQIGLDAKAWPSPERSAWSRLQPYGKDEAWYNSHLRVAHAAATAGYDPRDVNGLDAVRVAEEGYVAAQFGSATTQNDDAWAILALRAAGFPASDERIQAAARNLEAGRSAGGGWGYLPGLGGTTDVTGMVLAALVAAGRDVAGDARAVAFLDSTRDPETMLHRDNAQQGPNCQSTVWAVQAYRILGVAPDARTLRALEDLARPDGGFAYAPDMEPSDAWCTAEMILHLAGATWPLPGYHAGSVVSSTFHAREPVPLRVVGPFQTIAWDVPGATVAAGKAIFPRAGTYSYSVLAEGEGVRWRGQGAFTVLSARPILDVRLSAEVTPRHEPVTLDASSSRDPDGRVARLVVDWGDGNRTEGEPLVVSHAYALPARYQIRAHVADDAGIASGTFSAHVEARNRPPALPPLPPRLVANRTAPLDFPWQASDPDGDPVTLAWSRDLRFDHLGNHTLAVRATDPWGARVETNLTVEVVNLAPLLANLTLPGAPRAGEAFSYGVLASDPDGPAPRVTWSFGGNLTRDGPSGHVTLPAGLHTVTVLATDADGATRRLEATLSVLAPESREAATLAPPLVENLTVTLRDGRLRVAFTPPPPGVAAVVAWESDAGAGEAEAPLGALEVPLEATEARVRVTLRVGPLAASAEAGPVRAPPPPSLAAPTVHEVEAVAGEATTLRAELVEGAVAYRFELGDGNATGWQPVPEASHAWTRPGVYEVRVAARAEDGRASSATRLVTVTAPPRAPEAHEEVASAPAAAAEAAPIVEALREVTPPALPAPEEPRRESPMPWPLAPLLLAAWALRRRGTPAPSVPR